MYELSLDEELVADLRTTRQVIEDRGHTRGALIDGADGEGSVCLTGAAGIAVEGVRFIDWVKAGHNGYGEDFDWTPRSVRLLEALAEFSPYNGRGRRIITKFIRGIVGYNDGPINKESALAWIDKAISQAEKALAEAGRMSVEDDLR